MTRTNNDDEFDDNDNENEKGSSLNHNGENKKVQRRRKYWVVVVDDEEDLRLAVGDFLFDKGYHVTACSDAPALLEVCNEILADQQQQQTTARIDNTDRDDKQQSQEYENQSRLLQRSNGTRTGTRLPDAIISDVRMPGGPTGIELVKMIRSHPSPELRTIPIVLLTAKALTQDRIEGYKAGADFYLPKPFSPDELVSIVDNMISRKEQRKQAAEMVTAASTSLSTDRNDRRESISPLHIPDLLTLKQELEEIKGIMKQNAASVVQKTDVYLTDAEREVLDLVCDGYTNAEIAEHCGVGIIKMNRMILKLYEKTQTRTRTELVRWAVSTGYVS
jgi:DNA-binding NarL/FixJ family response regulator